MTEELIPASEVAQVERLPGRPALNYMQAVELGKVMAASGYYTDARDPAKAAVKVLIGLDLGISPTAALQGIHTIEDKGKVTFLIEGKIFAALIKMRPGYDYRFVERTIERVEIEFSHNGEICEPNIVWTMEDAQRAGLKDKKMYQKYPREMLTWRALAEGVRVHFPEILGGQPIYAMEEFGEDNESLGVAEALEPAKAQPLTDDRAEALRAKARTVKDEIDAINPEAVIPTRFAQAIRKAEHSHQQLENVVSGYEYLRDREAEFAELSEQLREAVPDEAEAIIERAKRRGEPQAKVDALRAALPGSDGSEGDTKVEAKSGAETGGESAP